MNYNVGDIVLYGSDGVCKIDEISKQKIGTETLSYYILRPIYNEKSTIYVPTQNKLLVEKMKQVPTKEELCSALEEIKKSDEVWEEDDTLRKENFKNVIDSGDAYKIISLIKLLYLKNDSLIAVGRKLRVFEEHILKDCEKILADEFSFVLNINRSHIKTFLRDKLEI